MSDLADDTDLAAFLGLTAAQVTAAGDLLQDKVDAAIAAFEKATHRTGAPFQSEQPGRVEIHDGFGLMTLLLDYPAKDVTEVILGTDLANPTTTLTVSDPNQMIWRVGDRKLRRTDGWRWQVGWWPPGFVRVTYDAQADLPADVKQAVLQLAASLYQEALVATTGAVKSESETLDSYTRSVTYDTQAGGGASSQSVTAAPDWLSAVKAHRRLVAV